MNERLQLADYRHRVARLYLSLADEPPEAAWESWRAQRDELFGTHPQSALDQEQRRGFSRLAYFGYDHVFRFAATLRETPDAPLVPLATGGEDGVVQCEQVGTLEFSLGSLALFWIRGYGGGLFLPFRDGTGGGETYGGGRYLADTLKGTMGGGLTIDGDDVILDFNFAYNPSCAYNSAFACPLAPRSNWLSPPIRAGEQVFAKAT